VPELRPDLVDPVEFQPTVGCYNKSQLGIHFSDPSAVTRSGMGPVFRKYLKTRARRSFPGKKPAWQVVAPEYDSARASVFRSVK